MEAGTADRRHVDGVEDDRRPARPCGASSTPTTSPPATRSTARGSDVTFARGRRDRPRDRPRPDRPRHPARRARLHPVPTRAPEWTYATSRSPAPAPSSCRSTRRTRPRSASGSRATPSPSRVVCEDADAGGEDRRRPRAPAGPAHDRRHRPGGRRRPTPSRSTRSASAAASRDPAELEARAAAVAPDDPFTFIYTSGTTGPPKGCVLTHGNYRRMLDMCETLGVLRGTTRIIYLFLPLAHAFALLIQLLVVRRRRHDRLLRRRPEPDRRPSCRRSSRPTCPSVPRIFEKVYTLVMASQPAEVQAQMKAAAGLGVKVRDMVAHGRAGAAGAAGEVRRRPTSSCSRTCARSSAAASSTRSPARRRSRPRSSSSSTAAACRCSRATA